MALIKVSVENIETNENCLYEIDMSKTLDENIFDLCSYFQTPYSPSLYGLKLISTNDGKVLHTHISNDNFSEIKQGFFLKLVYSLTYMTKRIFDHISDTYKERSFQDLRELSVDPEFIKEVYKAEKHLVVMHEFTTKELNDYEATACLITIVHLMQKRFITDINTEFLEKIIAIIKTSKNYELIKYALSILQKILCHPNKNFDKWKEEVIKNITITDMMNFITNKESTEDQYGALLVINNLIRCCKGEKRQQLIKEINQKKCREAIYTSIIVPRSINNATAHELYIYQTHLLSLLSNALTSTVGDTQAVIDEFEPIDNEVKKRTLIIDFEDHTPKNKATSVENLLELDDVRISLASISSTYTENPIYSSRIVSTATNGDYNKLQPCLLTIEALRHYRKHHFNNFSQTQVEESIYHPGIIPSSERVVRMLCKLLHIGVEPDRQCTVYQPSIFICSSRTPFFFELFSRTMWLLSKTRREMKASTLLDYEKVISILSKQVKLALQEKPMDLKKLTQNFVRITYQTVTEKLQKEKEAEMEDILQRNPSVQSLKVQFNETNDTFILQKRLNLIKVGTTFPKFNDNKKISGNFRAELSSNEKDLITYDYDVPTKVKGQAISHLVADITHVIEGKACPHVKNNAVKDPRLAFSIIVNHETWINFKAADRKSAAYWTDALYMLTGRETRSEYFHKEKNELTKMDLLLHLIELQNVSIPKKAPPVPPSPFDIKPLLLPKPKNLHKE